MWRLINSALCLLGIPLLGALTRPTALVESIVSIHQNLYSQPYIWVLYLFWIGISMLAFPLDIKHLVYPRLISGTLSCFLFPFGVHKLSKWYYHPVHKPEARDLEKCGQQFLLQFLLPLFSSIYYKDSRLSPLGISGDLNVLSIFTLWYNCPPHCPPCCQFYPGPLQLPPELSIITSHSTGQYSYATSSEDTI